MRLTQWHASTRNRQQHGQHTTPRDIVARVEEDEGARTVDDETAEDAGSTGVASESEPNADENEVEMIVGKKVDTNEVLYKVWWAGCDAIDDTWEPEQGLTHVVPRIIVTIPFFL